MRKYYSLIDKVYSLKNLESAFKKVKKNRGSAGIDGVSVFEFETRLEEELNQLATELREGSYRPGAVKRVKIPKPDGSFRNLGIPTVRDRVVQQALLNVLQPIFDPDFHPSSYGYRPGRSAAHALAKAERFARHYGLSYVVDMDLSKCFDRLAHDEILKGVNRRVSDGKVLRLIEQFLKSGVLDSGQFIPTEIGSPQGGVISPLLMNIYLDRFDQYMKDQGIRIVRYADDILIFARSRSEAGRYGRIATEYLEGELKLQVNRKKTHLTDLWQGISFLGFIISEIGLRIQPEKIKRFKDRVRELTPRNHGRALKSYVRELSYLLRGFSNYFRVGFSKGQFRNLMSWVRRRIRAMQLKEWKSWKKLHKQLKRLGYRPPFEKIRMSSWRNAACPLVHRALPNAWFEELGLFNMEKVETNTLHQYYNEVLNKV